MTGLQATSVSLRLGGAPVLDDVDLRLDGGELVGLIGPNGAGKTTLLRVMAGLLPAAGGEVTVDGQTLAAMPRQALARTLGYLPQDGGSHWPLTVATLVALGRLPHQGPWRGPDAADRAAVERALAACDIAALADRPVNRLSGGERARVLLARALAGEPRILLADEPVAGLDPGHQLDVMQRLSALARDGAGVLAVLHDLTLAARFCDRLVLLDRGRVIAEGDADHVLSPDLLARCYGIRAHHALIDGNPVVIPLARASDGGGDAVR
jgi:iron complex transport system ATP-binding protein